MTDLFGLGAHYRELSAELTKLRELIYADALAHPEVSDDAYAEALGWKVETVKKWRYPRDENAAAHRPPTKRETALSLLSVHWQTAESVIPFLAAQLDWQQSSVKSLLRQLESEGLVQSQGKPVTFRGKKGKKRTHYRRTPSATDESLSI